MCECLSGCQKKDNFITTSHFAFTWGGWTHSGMSVCQFDTDRPLCPDRQMGVYNLPKVVARQRAAGFEPTAVELQVEQ